MFERRLKLFLALLLLFALVLLLRAAQLQVLGVSHWREQAADSMKRPRQIETTRGAIVDRKGRPLALDVACVDARVDYRAIIDPPNAEWLKWQAIGRLSRRMGESYSNASYDRRLKMREAEEQQIQDDIDAMWDTLAREGGTTREEIEEARRAIVNHVDMRRRVVWFARYNRAVAKHKERDPSPWYRNWLIDGSGDLPELDRFEQDVSEEEEAHTILSDIDPETHMILKKGQENFPGLILSPGVRRDYPYGAAACHVIGRLGRVMREDIKSDPKLGVDPLRQYQYNDEIGRGGIESLCEPVLRGSRGQVIRLVGEDTELERTEPAAGKDVKISIDIELQKEVEAQFKKVRIRNDDPDKTFEALEMHGAAIAIDVKSGDVLALASNPTYDLNEFDELYGKLSRDDVNQPLLNRATQQAVVPGSTVKPIVGLGAITDGLLGVEDGIECTGYMIVNGRKIRDAFRCWTASKFAALYPDDVIAHHSFPVPHPTGHLTLADGLERSCNIYFETAAGLLKIGGLHKWYDQFGLGRRTGLGIAEASGRLPSPIGLPRDAIRRVTWFGGIGQGQVTATPIQMANVAATLARDGIWERPHLLTDRSIATTTQPVGPDRVDLKIPPAALAAARKGMINVVNSRAGTGTEAHRDDITIAGKTGTAQASAFSIPIRDDMGEFVRDSDGKVRRTVFEPASYQNPHGDVPWFRGFGAEGKATNHAWFIGYAPAEKPVIAFAVMVEYGGSGGWAAASVASGMIDACARHGYLGEAFRRMQQPGSDQAEPLARVTNGTSD